MAHFTTPARPTWIAGLVLGAALSTSAWAQDAAPAQAAPAASAEATAQPQQPKLPPPDPAAEKAVQTDIKALVSAINNQSAFLTKASFTDEFNEKISGDQMTQVFAQVHQSMGDCRLVGQVKTPVSFIGSFLLDCQKGYVPVDLAVENKAPYRIHSLLIRPGYTKQ